MKNAWASRALHGFSGFERNTLRNTCVATIPSLFESNINITCIFSCGGSHGAQPSSPATPKRHSMHTTCHTNSESRLLNSEIQWYSACDSGCLARIQLQYYCARSSLPLATSTRAINRNASRARSARSGAHMIRPRQRTARFSNVPRA